MDEIDIVPYDPAWPGLFAAEAARLRAVLDPDQVRGIEHFGSTAVPGLAAKPIIDILISVVSLATAKATMVRPITALGYLYWDENPKMDRMFFVKGLPPHAARRTHHVHITEPDNEMWRLRLPFRDHLRAHPDEARRYEALKRALAERYPTDRDRYTEAKTDYIERVYREIGLTPDRSGK
jgi:GrpB-like predicted nucleotidyltransferase (UPF0157 family)